MEREGEQERERERACELFEAECPRKGEKGEGKKGKAKSQAEVGSAEHRSTRNSRCKNSMKRVWKLWNVQDPKIYLGHRADESRE